MDNELLKEQLIYVVLQCKDQTIIKRSKNETIYKRAILYLHPDNWSNKILKSKKGNHKQNVVWP